MKEFGQKKTHGWRSHDDALWTYTTLLEFVGIYNCLGFKDCDKWCAVA